MTTDQKLDNSQVKINTQHVLPTYIIVLLNIKFIENNVFI